MAFIGTNTLTQLLQNSQVISPIDPDRIKNGAYELSLGAQVFQTDSSPKEVKYLSENEKIEIKPGQFALLLTKEYVTIPEDKIAFISIKASVKFMGLVNVSGFHVDPGFEGNLLFSVYNAGPSNIVLSNGTPYFPIWFAELNERQDYKGSHEKQTKIPDAPVQALSQGELASPNVLSKRIDDVKHMKTKIEWAVLAVLAFLIALTAKVWTDSNALKDAVEFGYKKKADEVASDSANKAIQVDFTMLINKLDTLTKVIKEKKP
jgi:dCTP deaminase